MDIAKLGISLDPARLVQGAARAKQALREIGEGAKTELRKVDDASGKAGQAVDKMAQSQRRSFGSMASGIVGFMDSLGLMNGAFGNVVRRGDSLIRSGSQIGQMLKSTGSSAGSAASGLAQAGSAASSASGGIASMAASSAGLGVALGALIAVAIALAAALGALAIVYKAFSVGVPIAAKFEADRVAIETLIGSTTKAKAVMGELAALGAKTPLETPELIGAARSLLAFNESAETVTATLKRIGDVSQGVQAPIGEIATLYGKARVQGTLFAEDINQLVGRGIPVMELFAQQMGVGVNQVKKMASEGKLTFGNLEKAFVSLTDKGGQFYNMMERQSQTFNGKVSTLTDNWNGMLRDMSTPVMETLKPFLDRLIDAVAKLTPYAVAFGQAIADGLAVFYQFLSEGRIGELVGLMFRAGMEQAAVWWVQYMIQSTLTVTVYLTTQLINAVAAGVTMFTNLMVAAITGVINFLTGGVSESHTASSQVFQASMGVVVDYIAVSIYNAFGAALNNVANAFLNAMIATVNVVSKAINAITDGFRKIPGAEAVLGAKGTNAIPMLDKANASVFTPMAVPDLSKAVNGIVGTTQRDALKREADLALQLFRDENKGLKDIENPNKKVKLPGGAADDGKGGKGKSEEDIKKAIVISEPLRELANQWSDMEKNMIDGAVNIAHSISDNMTGAIMSLVDGTKTAKQAFADMATSIINDIVKMVIQMYIQLAIATALKAMGYGGAGASAHTGGVAGSSTMTRGNVPTYHTGGMTSAESAIKVERGETILTKRRAEELERALSAKQQKQSGKRGGDGVTIINSTDKNEVLDIIASNPNAIMNALGRRQPQLRKLSAAKERP